MSLSRFVLSASKKCSIEALNPLRRFGRRFQSRSYSRSSWYGNGRPAIHTPVPVKTQGSQSWSAFIIPAAGLLGIAGGALFIHYNDERRVVLKGQGNNSERNVVLGPIIGGPFTLIDAKHQLVTEQDLLGNWVLLYFGCTSSPDVGPEQVQMMAKAIDFLESKQNVRVLPVFITIDPQRDSPSQLQAYLKEFDSRIVGLTGPDAAIRQMAQEYRVYFRKVEEDGDDYLVESSHNMYLMNPNMEVVRCFGVEYNAEELLQEILKEVKRSITQ
ncbi:protein SCO1 homolog 2, mitochondrial [Vitis riparia]|uniref:protein SCO1 homolog 2, mitochondrial n=1 Tax=Vitis riparia TaxID=96939 RepID=UPI00155A610F|nr:protein SCO1 homolog 2, mitochondrial [Vitis riparia]